VCVVEPFDSPFPTLSTDCVHAVVDALALDDDLVFDQEVSPKPLVKFEPWYSTGMETCLSTYKPLRRSSCARMTS
jgi:hypothetical protein